MLTRFCLYGFLKNQRYFEPVFILALLDKGLGFGLIGVLFGFRELIVAVLEIPSGAAADVLGRRGSLVLATGAYIVSFAVFALAEPVWMLFLAMACYGVGEAFRSGTHKALIFRWLEIEGRTREKTRVYGLTRSWSKYGSALAVVMTGLLLGATTSYEVVFAATIVPYALLLVNLLTYPRALEASPARDVEKAKGEPGAEHLDDGAAESPRAKERSLRQVWRHTLDTLKLSLRRRALRRLIVSSMGFDGMFHAAKDYLQPVLAAIALSMLASRPMEDEQAVAAVLTPVYVGLYVLAGLASRWSHRFSAWAGGERQGMARLWVAFGVCFGVVLLPVPVAVAGAFVALHAIQNLWRPMLIARFDDEGEEARGATILSIESQARHLATMVLAPAIGFAVQAVSASPERVEVWPIGVVGVMVAVVAFSRVDLEGTSEGNS